MGPLFEPSVRSQVRPDLVFFPWGLPWVRQSCQGWPHSGPYLVVLPDPSLPPRLAVALGEVPPGKCCMTPSPQARHKHQMRSHLGFKLEVQLDLPLCHYDTLRVVCQSSWRGRTAGFLGAAFSFLDRLSEAAGHDQVPPNSLIRSGPS